MLDRIPPQNIEAEQSVLGAVLIEQSSIAKISDLLVPEDFYREAHRLIYRAAMGLFERGEAIDFITVVDLLRRDNTLEQAGGIAYVTSLANGVPTAANITYHAKIVQEKSLLRRLIGAATDIASMGYAESEEVDRVLDSAEQKILEVATRKTSQDFQPIKEIIFSTLDKIDEMHKAKGGITGLSTGFTNLDKLTGGFQRSDLILIAARPSMGKTAFVLNVAQHMATRDRKAVAIFSLEMPKEQLAMRMMCAEGLIDSQRFRTGAMSNEEWSKLVDAADRLSGSPMYIDDTANVTAIELRNKARRISKEFGLDCIIIDYLQLMDGGAHSRIDNRQQQISYISRSLKGLARELRVPVIALSQLSRGPESRTNRRPMLSDLRESGSLEQDADLVAFLYRDDYYNPESEKKNITELLIAKNRNGPTETVELYFHKNFTRFTDYTPRQD
ncbi:MAG: replicative DNA helicase [Veillonellaceae bacterium]|nr:replicative DNA helicase [Veillonellaceae bacterium]